MRRGPPGSKRNDTLLPYTRLVRSLRDAADQLPAGFGREERGVEIGLDVAGRQRVDPYAVAREFQGECPGQVNQAGLAGAVRRDGAGRTQAGEDRKSTRELQSLMRISYAVFCLKKTNLHVFMT